MTTFRNRQRWRDAGDTVPADDAPKKTDDGSLDAASGVIVAVAGVLAGWAALITYWVSKQP